MIGEFVGQGAAETERRAVRADDVDPGELRLLARIQRELRRPERLLRGHDAAPVAFVEPFRLHTHAIPFRLAAFQPEPEHLQGIRGIRGKSFGMHAIASIGRSKMRESGAGQPHACVVGVIDGWGDPPLAQRFLQVDLLAIASPLNDGTQGRGGGDRSIRQRIHACHTLHTATHGSVGGGGDDSVAERIEQLDQSQRHGSSVPSASPRGGRQILR